ncbi:MAG TPA: peptide chain release factor N(5)-glutamine methyltransferase [Dissulfurispiraceae bacterium]|nr:peptide chain release factor N(5)-glutamine methyltransferase [Dissulfurispiraceae bacterium]
MIVGALVQEIAQRLREHGVPDSAKEAELIVSSFLRLSRTQLYASAAEVSAESIEAIQQHAARRAAGEPIHYIIGHLEFMGLRIAVGPGVLIPRPETELLVEEAIKRLRGGQSGVRSQGPEDLQAEGNNTPSSPMTVLDLCTGSGCIALSLARAFPDATVFGVDISPAALQYAQQNGTHNSIDNATFVAGDLFAPFTAQKFTCITANPPYIKTSDIQNLQNEIREHEPVNALDGGQDGLDFYRRILAEAQDHLVPGGTLIMELGYDQADAVTDLARGAGFSDIRCIADYAGIRRIFIGSRITD